MLYICNQTSNNGYRINSNITANNSLGFKIIYITIRITNITYNNILNITFHICYGIFIITLKY